MGETHLLLFLQFLFLELPLGEHDAGAKQHTRRYVGFFLCLLAPFQQSSEQLLGLVILEFVPLPLPLKREFIPTILQTILQQRISPAPPERSSFLPTVFYRSHTSHTISILVFVVFFVVFMVKDCCGLPVNCRILTPPAGGGSPPLARRPARCLRQTVGSSGRGRAWPARSCARRCRGPRPTGWRP